MAAVAKNPAFAKKVGIKQSVGEEFLQADKGKKFKGGGMATDKLKKLFKGKDTYAEEMKEAKAIKSGKITPSEYAKGEKMEGEGMKKGGMCKKAMGGRIASKGEHAVQKKSKRGAEIFCGGGMSKAKKYARGGGIEVRGKTRGKII